MKLKLKSCRRVAVCTAALVLFAVCLVPICHAVDAVEANAAIDEAEHALGSGYVVAAEAEDAGANVSMLLNKLGSASALLSAAHVAYRARDYENASALAIECNHAAEGIAGDALSLKADAEKTVSDRLLLTVAGSCVGLVLLGVFGFIGWRFLKRRYYSRVLDTKPVVEAVQ
jgi:hypothetical protein